MLLASFVCATLLSYGGSFAIKPLYTARLSFISPQPQQSSALSALASLSALSGLGGAGAGALKSPAEQYISLMQSVTVSDRLIDQFKLMEVYDEEYKVDARKKLANRVKMAAGKKDSIITVDVDDHDKARAAEMANAYLEQLRQFANTLALTEAQQRRVFFEKHLEQTRVRLTQAQSALQQSGFNAGAMKAEPKAAAESYAQVKAKVAALEVRLQAMRRTLTDRAPEIQQQLAALAELRAQLQALEKPLDTTGSENYIGAYRDYKYQEAILEIYARQFEMAKLDESKEGALFQVIDKAAPPEKKSKPTRSLVGLLGGFLGLLIAATVIIRNSRRTVTAAR